MADVRYVQATRIYPGTDVPAVDALDLAHRGRRVRRSRRALRFRQDDRAAHARGARGGRCGRDLIGEPRRHGHAAEAPRRRDGLPELRALPVPHGRREHRLPAPDREGEEVRARAARAGGRGAARSEEYLERKPGQLSGGQRQRVAMGRAIVRQPSVFLMDEPLSNLDAKLRVQMRADIAALQSRLGTTTVYVTHDQSEAMTLGHRVAVLKDGRLQQCDAAARALRPAREHIRRRLHRLARDEPLRGRARLERRRHPRRREVPLPAAAARSRLAPIVLGLRPEALELSGEVLPARVEVVEEIGADAYVFCVAELGRPDEARRPLRRAPVPDRERASISSASGRSARLRPRDGREDLGLTGGRSSSTRSASSPRRSSVCSSRSASSRGADILAPARAGWCGWSGTAPRTTPPPTASTPSGCFPAGQPSATRSR